MLADTAASSLPAYWNLVAFISINLAVMNLLPIPGLDGGRILLLAVETIRRKPLDPRFENYINAAGMVLVLSMAVLSPLMTLLMIPFNMVSRHMERRADTFAADCGLGQPLMDALKRLSRDNLSDLNPHPFLATVGYSHPTVGERIQVIEKAMGRQGK